MTKRIFVWNLIKTTFMNAMCLTLVNRLPHSFNFFSWSNFFGFFLYYYYFNKYKAPPKWWYVHAMRDK